MTDKIFTEEDYQTIANVADNTIKGNFFGEKPVRNFWNELLDSRLGENIFLCTYGKEIMAIANPATRHEAKEKYVEKEKKYHWISKKQFTNGKFKILVESANGYPIDMFYTSSRRCGSFTETEVREACYNPDMFDREEV
ncbi:hypothetical protein GHU05_07030 [Fructobacillus tropaeoli]|uniref:hypothetical protein n=1 Tax=Fructobacillus tropaeoli TaxID=709323 RepID=UPI0014561BB1|nr:hypothetical protein [Fructobacillus tropaeoli]NLS38673.1 hypothetical protein [Fructobacillus tropaeoli]